jgi:hypothetical protein
MTCLSFREVTVVEVQVPNEGAIKKRRPVGRRFAAANQRALFPAAKIVNQPLQQGAEFVVEGPECTAQRVQHANFEFIRCRIGNIRERFIDDEIRHLFDLRHGFISRSSNRSANFPDSVMCARGTTKAVEPTILAKRAVKRECWFLTRLAGRFHSYCLYREAKDMSMRSGRMTRRTTAKEPVLWIVDSEQWPRACLRAELIERGYDPYGFIAMADALDYLSRRISPRPEALILELRGQNLSPETLEAIRNLRVPTILLGGGSELNDPLITQGHWDFVLKRPFSLGTVADLVEKIAPQPKGRFRA